MNGPRSLSVEVLRDIETPDVSIDAIVWGLEKTRYIAPSLEIIARNGMLRVNAEGTDHINTGNLPLYVFNADLNIIVTGRPIIVPERLRADELPRGKDYIGTSLPHGRDKPFALIDGARSNSPANTAMHELGHLLKFPNRGRNFDGNCHCKIGGCVMHREVSPSTDFCNNCSKQLAKSVFRMIDLKYTPPELAG